MKFRIPFHIPDAHESLLCFGRSSEKALPAKNLKLLVWNVYKGKDPRWENEFLGLVRNHDLVLLQEAVTDHKMPRVWRESFANYAWNMAASFLLNPQHATGVAIGSRAEPLNLQFVRTTSRELFVLTPKVALLSQFHIEGRSEKLLVVNTHSLNFTTTAHFIRALEEKLRLIGSHVGPLIFAGDFNTWNFRRWMLLVEMLSQLRLYPVEFATDPRSLKLDHIFVRDIEIQTTEVLHTFKGSDHAPLEVLLSFK